MRAPEAVELMLVQHDATAKAYKVSPDGDESAAVWLPKSLTMRSEACGGFERWGRNCQRKLHTVHEFTMPAFIAQSKGLAA